MKTVLIAGAGVGGPALAHWLSLGGWQCTVIERAKTLRAGGYAVDFRGAAMTALQRMGVVPALKAVATEMGTVSYVDANNRRLADLPSMFLSGELEVLRGDLSQVLYDATRDRAKYVFGDSITALAESATGVEVIFQRGGPRVFDLVIGADGVHSQVRGLLFGDESQFIRHLGYQLAIFTVPNDLGLDHTGRYYNVPGKLAAVYSARNNTECKASFYFESPPLSVDPFDVAAQKQIVAEVFEGEGWEVPRLLASMRDADDFYFDSISQIHLPQWSKGRVALLGDAACCASPLSGMGTGIAIVGAFILATELQRGDHATAFARYEARMRPYVAKCQKFGESGGGFMVPGSKLGIWFRNLNMRLLPHVPWRGLIAKMAAGPSNAIALDA